MVNIKTLLDILATLVALLGTAPVMAFLDPPVLGLFLLALAGGAWCDRHDRFLPGLEELVRESLKRLASKR